MVDKDAGAHMLPLPADNAVVTFRTDRSGVHGRLVRLGVVADKILKTHAMPDAAARALGEALGLAALLGSALGQEGNISVQTRTDGQISVLYADCEAAGKLRGYARFDDQLSETNGRLGKGHLAVTIDTGAIADRYQGVIAVEEQRLDFAAAAYFEQRESLPTFIRLAAAQHYSATAEAVHDVCWRAGGLMIQSLESATNAHGEDDWQRTRLLAATIEDHELLDPMLTPERLLLRLFHEEGVILEKVVPLVSYCKCSRERVANVLATFGADELSSMRDDSGNITATCEFCGSKYDFQFAEISGGSA